ncbi:MAG: site-2 protease family protein [Anaerolineae bacterium]
MSFSWIPANEGVLDLEEAVAPVFSVHEVESRAGGRIIVMKGRFLRSPEMVYEEVAAPLRAQGFVPVLRQEGGLDVLMAYPAPGIRGATRPLLHLGLFVATVLSTLWAGTLQSIGQVPTLTLFLRHWTEGLPFTIALLGILGVHEFGHYFVARRYGLDVTLPYFIPFPLNAYTGTLGAVIRIRSPFESRKALFDVGIAGPLAGLAVAVPVVAMGLQRAELMTFSPRTDVLVFNEPLLFQWMARAIVGERPPGTDILMNPLLMAGWLGFLITAINLLPVSQLDGGHIAYSILGRLYRPFAWAIFLAVVIVTVMRTQGFGLMALFIFIMGIDHPPALNDLTRVGGRRVALGILTLLLALTLVTLTPFETIPAAASAP